MAYQIARTDEEIDDTLNDAVETQGRWPGMTYEQGVEAALRWVTGEEDLNPLEEE